MRALGAGLVAAALVGGGVLVGCGEDGPPEMDPPSAAQRATTTTTVATTLPPTGGATGAGLVLSSPAFSQGGVIPEQFTCRGAGVSPPLQWANLPAGVAELAIVVRDPDAGGFVHWVITGLSPTAGGIAEDGVPAGSVEALNQTGSVGWFGPCPPSGTHTYQFRLYALSESPGVTQGQDAAAAAAQVENAPSLSSTTFTATASAPG